MDIDQFDTIGEDEDEIDIGSSANSATSEKNNVTATGQSPPKKQKGDQGSNKE